MAIVTKSCHILADIIEGVQTVMFGWLKRSKKTKEAPPLAWQSYKAFEIAASPIQEGQQYRVAGFIRSTDAEPKETRFIRADIIPSKDEAIAFSLKKAELMIDQLGDKVFES